MSSYIRKAINPKTGKEQVALFLDNYYGEHIFGVAFKRDGTSADFNNFKREDFDFFREEELNN